MNLFERILYFLQTEMVEPKPWGWFHIMWIIIALVIIYLLYKSKDSEKNLEKVLKTYGVVALILEILKQLIWSFNYDPITNIVTWKYQWYAFPYQLCSIPMYLSLISLGLLKTKLRNYLLSFLAYFTILGSISVILLPESCFVNDILVNIHTMWLHVGSFVVSVYLFMKGHVKISLKTLKQGFIVFIAFVIDVLLLNVIMYNSGLLHGETFNMFYISPYFTSTLPVFDVIQKSVPYPVFLFSYLLAFLLGGLIIYLIAKLINKIYFQKSGN